MQRHAHTVRTVWLVLLFAGLVAWSAQSEAKSKDPFKGFDEWVEEVMAEWHCPGIGLAVVKDGEVLLARGYGYRDNEKKLPVDEDTLFAIGSNTKSFTAMLLGMLVDDGKLDWDTPVIEYLPDFRLQDTIATQEMTPRDLLTHRSGLPRHDLAWLQAGRSREELYGLLRHLEPTASFRSAFQYQNLMYMTAGILAEKVGGESWEAQVKKRILEPLGMERANLSVDDMPKDDNVSFAYGETGGTIERIPYRNIDAVGPAGSINASAAEMAKYVLMHLNDGKVGDEQLLSAANTRAMRSPQMVIGGPIRAMVASDPEFGPPSYGLGLMISNYRGRAYVRHGGGIDGFISAMEWLPDDGIGVVLLSNTSANRNVPTIVVREVFDRVLGLDPIDWSERIRKRQQAQEEAIAKAREADLEGRKPETSPSHALADYVGSYQNPGYGVSTVSLQGDALSIEVVGFEAPLEHYHYDIFSVPYDLGGVLAGWGGQKVTFGYDKSGEIDRLAVPLQGGIDDIEFTRLGDLSMNDPEFLKKMTGKYSLNQQSVVVVVRGEELSLTVPGQPTYALVPDRDTKFNIKELDGYRVEFHLDEGAERAGAVTFHQPSGIFRAERDEN